MQAAQFLVLAATWWLNRSSLLEPWHVYAAITVLTAARWVKHCRSLVCSTAVLRLLIHTFHCGRSFKLSKTVSFVAVYLSISRLEDSARGVLTAACESDLGHGLFSLGGGHPPVAPACTTASSLSSRLTTRRRGGRCAGRCAALCDLGQHHHFAHRRDCGTVQVPHTMAWSSPPVLGAEVAQRGCAAAASRPALLSKHRVLAATGAASTLWHQRAGCRA